MHVTFRLERRPTRILRSGAYCLLLGMPIMSMQYFTKH